MTLESCKLRANYFAGQSFVSPSFLCILIFLFYLSLSLSFFWQISFIIIMCCCCFLFAFKVGALCEFCVYFFLYFFFYVFFFCCGEIFKAVARILSDSSFCRCFRWQLLYNILFFLFFFLFCCVSLNNISVHFTLLLLQPVANISTDLLCLAYSLSWCVRCVCGVCVCCGYIYSCCSHSSCEKINKPKPAQVSPTCRAGNGQENRLPAPTSTSTRTRTRTRTRWCRLSSAR